MGNMKLRCTGVWHPRVMRVFEGTALIKAMLNLYIVLSFLGLLT